MKVSRLSEVNRPHPPSKRRKMLYSIPETIDTKEVVDACMTLVTVNGRPFKLLDDSGFRMLLDPLILGLGGSLSISAGNIGKHVSDTATILRQVIKDSVKNSLVCVKVYCAK